MARGRLRAEAADEASVDVSLNLGLGKRAGGRHSAMLSGPEAARLPESGRDCLNEPTGKLGAMPRRRPNGTLRD